MEPTLHVGSLVFVKRTPAAALRVGDIITFNDPHVSGKMDTHRIVRILHRPNGQPAFRTKGDANRDRDPWTIVLPDAVGRERFTVPYAGYAMWYIRTREVRTLLIGLVALSTLVTLLRHTWRREPAPAAEGQ
jgi:signal peptidase